MDIDLPVLAGTVSTVLFMISTLPMLLKAFRSKDLRSYSFGNMVLANTGNAVHSLYVYSLPPGPIWWLHTFHMLTTGLMLAWYLRYEVRLGPRRVHQAVSHGLRQNRATSGPPRAADVAIDPDPILLPTANP
jgi:uncharacterized protein with PQ loop repeat